MIEYDNVGRTISTVFDFGMSFAICNVYNQNMIFLSCHLDKMCSCESKDFLFFILKTTLVVS